MAKKPDPIQNDVPDYGEARSMDPRQRAFGVLGFDDRPEAQIGGTVTYKTTKDKNPGGAGG